MYLLDTNILSRVIRRKADHAFLERLRRHPPDSLFTSCVCVMELRLGAAQRQDGGALWRRIQAEILSKVQILDFGMEEAMVAGDVIAHLRTMGEPIDVEDIMIAATARTRGFAVVTNNVRHFRRVPGLAVEDWSA